MFWAIGSWVTSGSSFFVAVYAFQHCFLGLQSLCFGFGFGRGRDLLLRLRRHLHGKPSYSFVSVFLLFLLPYPGRWGFSFLLGSLRSSASIQQVFCTSCSTCQCIFDAFVGRKVISTSYSSTILKVPPLVLILIGTYSKSWSSPRGSKENWKTLRLKWRMETRKDYINRKKKGSYNYHIKNTIQVFYYTQEATLKTALIYCNELVTWKMKHKFMRVLLLDGLKETFSYVTRFLIFFYFERHGTSEFTVEPEDRKKTKN